MSEKKVLMKPVTSSNVKEVGYSDKRTTLFVRFAGNALYKYEGVTRDVYDDLLGSHSVGSFISQRVVKGGYTYSKTNDDELGEGFEKVVKERNTDEKTLFLIDFSWLYYRSKFAYKELTTVVEGVTYGTGSIHGVYECLSSIFYYHKNADVLLCMDGVPMKQNLLNPDYKGDREYAKEMTEVHLKKWEVAKPFTLIPRVSTSYAEHMEADETIAFYTQLRNKYLKKYAKVIVFSSDGDLRQLISSEDGIFCASEIDEQGVKFQDEKYMFDYGPKGLEKLEPKAVAMYLALTGDASDNIKGVYMLKKEFAKMIALECPTPDQLKSFLQDRALVPGKYQKEFKKLQDNMSQIERSFKLTNIDPLSIPVIVSSYKDINLDFFDRYDCTKARAGVERMIKEQS